MLMVLKKTILLKTVSLIFLICFFSKKILHCLMPWERCFYVSEIKLSKLRVVFIPWRFSPLTGSIRCLERWWFLGLASRKGGF